MLGRGRIIGSGWGLNCNARKRYMPTALGGVYTMLPIQPECTRQFGHDCYRLGLGDWIEKHVNPQVWYLCEWYPPIKSLNMVAPIFATTTTEILTFTNATIAA
mmetsp:Transcript_22228/g.46495  ORF Transcript_22228/g.46495 Transcript_22228/m.46495 type:complete len:103 (-) Transcript_22228:18-326(-)